MVRLQFLLTAHVGAIESESLMQSHLVESLGSFSVDPGEVRLKTHGNTSLLHSMMKTKINDVHNSLTQSVHERMKTGAPPVSADVASALAAQFDILEQGLESEVVNQQVRADALNDPIQACNDAKSTAFTSAGGVDFLHSAVTEARSQHSNCRVNEDTNCNEYLSQAATARSSAPTCSHADHYGVNNPIHPIGSITVADTVVSCMDEHTSWMNLLNSLKDKQLACSTSVSTCNAKQHAFETDFCVYKQGLDEACDAFAVCLQPASQTSLVEQRATKKAALQTLESSQKQLYIAVQTSRCFVNLLKTDSVPTQSDFDSCSNLAPSTSKLDLTYPEFVVPGTCDKEPVAKSPGDGQWRIQEYDNKDWKHLLQPVTACPAPGGTTIGGKKYMFGGEGTNTCPSGYTGITSKTECEEVAPSLCTKGFQYQGNWAKGPLGCFIKDGTEKENCQMFYNTDTNGDASAGATYHRLCVKP